MMFANVLYYTAVAFACRNRIHCKYRIDGCYYD